MRVLVFQEDAGSTGFVTRALSERGFELERCKSFEDVRRCIVTRRYRLVSLFVSRMDERILETCRNIREFDERIPIIIVTSDPSADHLLRALEAGVDEYLNHGCEEDEIVARMCALIRRTDARHMAKLRGGAILVDEYEHRAYVGSRPLDLTLREFSLLRYLVIQVGEVVSREEIRSKVWHALEAAESNVIEVHIGRLRQKLGPAASQLRTVRGIGYCLLAQAPYEPAQAMTAELS